MYKLEDNNDILTIHGPDFKCGAEELWDIIEHLNYLYNHIKQLEEDISDLKWEKLHLNHEDELGGFTDDIYYRNERES